MCFYQENQYKKDRKKSNGNGNLGQTCPIKYIVFYFRMIV